jgi:hypothetical protein
MKHAMADAHALEHNGWTFSSFRGPIGNKDQVRAQRGDLRTSFPIPTHLPPLSPPHPSSQYRALEDELQVGNVPLPEMTYARNFLEVRHAPSGLCLRFDAKGALRSWHSRQRRLYGVPPHSGHAGHAAGAPDSAAAAAASAAAPDQPHVDVTKHDWTYANEYEGDALSPAPLLSLPSPSPLPLDALQRRDPILYYADVPLYASDLADRGIVECGVRLRVMSSGLFLLLLRTYQRLDRERVWLRDVRIAHTPDSSPTPSDLPLLLKDVQVRASPFYPLLAALRGGEHETETWDGPVAVLPRSPPPTVSTSPRTAPHDAAAAAAEVGTPPSSSPVKPVRSPIHPVVLESMRARAARQGLTVDEEGVLRSPDGAAVDGAAEGWAAGAGAGASAGPDGIVRGAGGAADSVAAAYSARFVPGAAAGVRGSPPSAAAGTAAAPRAEAEASPVRALWSDELLRTGPQTSWFTDVRPRDGGGAEAAPSLVPEGAGTGVGGEQERGAAEGQRGPSSRARLDVSADEVYGALVPSSHETFRLVRG